MVPDQRAYNRQLIEEFRATRSEGAIPLDGRPILLLTTTGAKSGQRHTTPLLAVEMHGRLFIIASKAGGETHPDWYRNVLAHPSVFVEYKTDAFSALAAPAPEAERAELWSDLVIQYPFFTEHQAKTARIIPIVELRRQEPGAS